MQKIEHRRLSTIRLLGFWSLLALLIGMIGGIPSARAADRYMIKGDQDCTSRDLKPSFGGTIVVDSNEVVCSDVTSFGGTVVIRGKVLGNLVIFGGNVVIDGTVDGDVSLYGSKVALPQGAHVYGNIHLCGDRWSEGENSQLHGSVFDCSGSVVSFLTNDEGLGVRFWSVLTWIALGILLTSLLPEHVMLVRTTARIKMRRSLILGLLSVLLAPAVLAVLIALIISIPLAIIVIVGLVAAWALGTVAIGWLIGEYILRSVAPQQNTRPLQVIVGLTVLILAGSLPYIGWLISIGAGLVGLGAVFLSRFGTRLYSQPRKPLL
jgi:hypothetical protein